MTITTIKFSDFAFANTDNNSNQYVGVGPGGNIISSVFVSWQTSTRPASPYDGLLGYNLDLKQYEYWDGTSSSWLQLASSTFAFPITLAQGGTGSALTANEGGIVYSDASAMQILSNPGASNKVLQSQNGASPIWSTPEYPSDSGIAGQLLRSNGTDNIYSSTTFADTYAINSLLYADIDNDVIGLATANNGVLVTDSSGVPSISSTLPAVTVSSSTSSATPGTIRALIGSMTGSNANQTSGNLVGVRGVVNIVGSSGSAFIYGTQGKIIATGTLAAGQFQAGIFGQLDISAATINGCQLATIWGDYGATSGTLTDQTGLYGIAMTNTTAAVLQGQLYLYGGAQNLMYLNTNSGLSGVTYFKNAGVSAGSWGNATPPTPSKVLKINVDGTDYYLPLVAQNT